MRRFWVGIPFLAAAAVLAACRPDGAFLTPVALSTVNQPCNRDHPGSCGDRGSSSRLNNAKLNRVIAAQRLQLATIRRIERAVSEKSTHRREARSPAPAQKPGANGAMLIKLANIEATQRKQQSLLQRILAMQKQAPPIRPEQQNRRPRAKGTSYAGGSHCTGVRPVLTDAKVFGGRDATIANWPGHVALRIRNQMTNKAVYFCGGTLIADQWVITAAHCVYKPRFNRDGTGYSQSFETRTNYTKNGFVGNGHLEIVYDTADLKSAKAKFTGVSRIIVHPGYDVPSLHDANVCGADQCPNNSGHDIALLKLDEPVSASIGRLSMSPDTDPFDDIPVPAMVAGYGRTDEGRSDGGSRLRFDNAAAPMSLAASHVLKETDLATVRQETCQKQYGPVAVGPGQICAADPQTQTTKDTCSGDSGGPLVVYDNNQCPYIVGLTSWGKQCAKPGASAVYTRVSYYSDWIRKHVNPAHAVSSTDTVAPLLVERGRQEFKRGMKILASRLKIGQGRVKIRTCSLNDKDEVQCADPSHLNHNGLFTLETTSSVSGSLILLNVTRFGIASLLYPDDSAPDARIAAGQRLVAPSSLVKTHLISDRGRLLAFVIPDARVASKIVARMNEARLNNQFEVFKALVDSVSAATAADRTAAAQWGFAALRLDVRY